VTDIVARPRLVSRLDARWQRPVVTVVAGPGFGKSTLIATASDGDSERQRVVAVAPGSGREELIGALTRTWSIPWRSGAVNSDAADRIAAGWWAMAPARVCTFVDDGHELDPDGAAFLADLADLLPPNAHLVVASRTPVLPQVAPLLNEDDLRLTDDELAALAERHGRPVSDLDGVAGWPALAALVAGTGVGSGEATVWREVLAVLEPRTRRALASLALAGPCDDRILEHLLGVDGPDLVDDLLARVPLSRWRRGRIEVHGLWTEPALAALSTRERQEVPVEVVRALCSVGRTSEAFARATEHGLGDEQLAVVRQVCTEERLLPDADTARRWLEVLAGDAGSLEAELLRGLSLRGRHPAEARRPLAAAAGLARQAGEHELEILALGLLGTVAFIMQDHPLGAEVAERAAEMAADGVVGAAVLVAMAQVIGLLAEGDPAGALGVIDALDPVAVRPLDGLRVLLRARSLCELGRADACLAQLEHDALLLRPYHFGVAIVAGRSRWMLGDLDGADAGLTRDAAACAADGRADDAAALHSVRRLIAAVTGRELPSGDPSGLSSPIGMLLHTLADAVVNIDDDPEPLYLAMRFAYDMGGMGAVLPEIRHLLWRAAPEVDQPPLEGAPEAARRVTRALVDGDLPASSDVLAGLSLLPRPEVAEITAAWCRRSGDERPPWASHLAASDRAATRRLLADAPDAVPPPGWVLDPDGQVEVRVLGPISVSVDGVEHLGELRRERVRALLWLLVTHPEISRREAAAALWPALEPDASANNLRTTLSYLSKVLDPDRAASGGAGVLEVTRSSLRLREDGPLDVDAWALHEDLRAARASERAGRINEALGSYRQAAGRWTGEPAQDLDPAEWLEDALRDLRAAFVESAVRAGELLLGRDDEAALLLAGRALDVDRWSLRASAVSVRANAGLGRDAAARQGLARHRSLAEELGLEADLLAPLVDVVARASAGPR
jgi:DNA-binding SARP family transcriptional activator